MKTTPVLASFLAALSLAGCDSAPEPAPASKVSLGSATAGPYTVHLLSDRALGTGLNAVFARVTTTATAVPVSDATVTIVPMMDMGTMQHSCPVSGPMAWDAAEALYQADLVFQMAGTWAATVTVTRPATTPVDARSELAWEIRGRDGPTNRRPEGRNLCLEKSVIKASSSGACWEISRKHARISAR